MFGDVCVLRFRGDEIVAWVLVGVRRWRFGGVLCFRGSVLFAGFRRLCLGMIVVFVGSCGVVVVVATSAGVAAAVRCCVVAVGGVLGW